MNIKILVLTSALITGLSASFLVKQYNHLPTVEVGMLRSGTQTINLFDPSDKRIRVVYFGYTHCPDVCPTSLAMLSAALKSLPESTLANIRPVFITLDPKRDDSETVKEYAGYFHPLIEGSTGNEENISALAKMYGVLYQITELENSSMKYAVDHSSYFYFLQPDGVLLEKVPHTLNPNMISNAITRLINNTQ